MIAQGGQRAATPPCLSCCHARGQVNLFQRHGVERAQVSTSSVLPASESVDFAAANSHELPGTHVSLLRRSTIRQNGDGVSMQPGEAGYKQATCPCLEESGNDKGQRLHDDFDQGRLSAVRRTRQNAV